MSDQFEIPKVLVDKGEIFGRVQGEECTHVAQMELRMKENGRSSINVYNVHASNVLNRTFDEVDRLELVWTTEIEDVVQPSIPALQKLAHDLSKSCSTDVRSS